MIMMVTGTDAVHWASGGRSTWRAAVRWRLQRTSTRRLRTTCHLLASTATPSRLTR